MFKLGGRLVHHVQCIMKKKTLFIIFYFAELEQAAALKYLYSWLQHHPKYGTVAPAEQFDSLYYADV